jgi:hypothetical protein
MLSGSIAALENAEYLVSFLICIIWVGNVSSLEIIIKCQDLQRCLQPTTKLDML